MADTPGQPEAPAGSSAEASGAAGTPVCPQCMALCEPNADFCRACGAPLSALAAFDPYKQIFVQGWFYRRATSRPTSFVVVLGMWLIFGPTVLIACCTMMPWSLQLSSWNNDPPFLAGMSIAMALGMLGLYAMILYRVTRRYLQQRAIKPGHCRKCGYDLQGLSEPRCPKCGSPFDPEEACNTQETDEAEAVCEADEPGDALVSATKKPPRPRSLSGSPGMGLIVGIVTLAVALCLYALCQSMFQVAGEGSLGPECALVAVVILFACGLLLARLTRRRQQQLVIEPGYCQYCNHSLRGLTEPRCPECGSPFDPQEAFATDEPDARAAGDELQPQ
jgi:predicted amidophosphoribosyltransferase